MRLIDRLREFLVEAKGEVSLGYLRKELMIEPGSPAWDGLRKAMSDLSKEKIVKPTGRNDGTYKVLKQVRPVQVFGRERRAPIEIYFPRDFETGMEFPFAEDIVVREGDLFLISGRSNYGKTALCMNFCAENIGQHPVLMGNEYTTLDGEPSPRFLERIDAMDWVSWTNGSGTDSFTLLPVFEDYAEYIIKDRVNLIDWINLDGEHYRISKVMEEIKRAVGKGVGIATIQKGEGADAGRGGQFTRDFADVEILLDSYGERETLLTLGKVKESKRRVSGRAYAFSIVSGVKLVNVREVQKCSCNKGWRGAKHCDECNGSGYRE